MFLLPLNAKLSHDPWKLLGTLPQPRPRGTLRSCELPLCATFLSILASQSEVPRAGGTVGYQFPAPRTPVPPDGHYLCDTGQGLLKFDPLVHSPLVSLLAPSDAGISAMFVVCFFLL